MKNYSKESSPRGQQIHLQNLDTKQNEEYLDQFDKLQAFGLYEAFAPLVNGAPADRADFSGPAAITNAWYQV